VDFIPEDKPIHREICSRKIYKTNRYLKSTDFSSRVLPKGQTHREVGTQSKGSVSADSLAAEV
jgi:hypothetical protein